MIFGAFSFCLAGNQFSGVTSFDVGHSHQFVDVTEPAPSGVLHTHCYSTFTSFICKSYW